MIAGIDLGGSQIRVAVAEPEGRIVATSRTRTSALGTPRRVADWAAGRIVRLAGTTSVHRVAVGAPGPVDPARGVLVNPPNLPGWRNVPLATLLADRLGCPVDLENDANLAAWGEYRHGAGRGSRTMVYITWSTGVGSGLVLDGRLFSGAHGAAGEVGHMIIDPKGPIDGCGQRGCVEAFCGGAALARETGESAVEIFEQAARGEGEAAAIVRQAATMMGYALINVTNLFDPDLIVMGGGVSRSWRQVAPVLLAVLRSSPFIRPSRRPRLRRARLGDRAGQVGAVEWARSRR
ncbi:MAG TPA: ROK family protein [Candidatus Dormibacteraeota bacterium]|nr:ROK family protein [Candidatus Dormibacteraeota bacterium]